jgi:hypothetical protein
MNILKHKRAVKCGRLRIKSMTRRSRCRNSILRRDMEMMNPSKFEGYYRRLAELISRNKQAFVNIMMLE